MIERYEDNEIAHIWSNLNKAQIWADIQLRMLRSLKQRNNCPTGNIPKNIQIDDKFVCLWKTKEEESRHDVAAFLDTMEDMLEPDVARYLHYGMTSSDLCDTGMAIQIRQSANIVINMLSELHKILYSRALKYKNTVMMGRTHGKYAQPTTFGLVLLSHAAEIGRNISRLEGAKLETSYGTLSGAVGTYAHTEPLIESDVMLESGLLRELVPTQIVPRDRHARILNALALVGASLERLATNIRILSRSEIDEVGEPFYPNQVGSSAMPHKKNPVSCEKVCGMARLLRSYAQVGMENVTLWNERDISHSSVERVVFPDAFNVVVHMTQTMISVMTNLTVNQVEMRRRVTYTTDQWESQMHVVESIDRGKTRKEARTNKIEDLGVGAEEYHLRNIDEIFKRYKEYSNK